MLRSFLTLGLWGALFALVFNLVSQTLLTMVGLVPAFLLLLVVVAIGIFFDLIGTAAAAAEETPFHAMAAARVPGAKTAVWLVRNAHKVTTVCNDLIGDISGTLSGAMGAAIVYQILLSNPNWSQAMLSTMMISTVAALTIGGKAAWKRVALTYSKQIIFRVARVIRFMYRRELGSKTR